MHSLAFRALDRHVVDGRADDPALVTAEGSWSFAQLLHESASLAGGLRELGVVAGTPLDIAVTVERPRVVSVLAVVRLGAEPDSGARYRIGGEPLTVTTPDESFDYDLVLRAGRVDPATAPARDAEGYADRLLEHYGDLLEPLIGGRPLA
ncbi:acyl-CoA synthetase [Aeromicrobium piscarium]|uniref:Acyl-CoA synthetase n=1 Tax=Aeromicrobium piscarium TaxID=2590901 RepID=A0A554SGE8_9ACTN|nr:acyl-CoA synthetase [Aeromicrobium piscarium]TSD65419.1 acyl-CoA synthetase [Aeromicrobium piscarium]